jgi:hypothetical protein
MADFNLVDSGIVIAFVIEPTIPAYSTASVVWKGERTKSEVTLPGSVTIDGLARSVVSCTITGTAITIADTYEAEVIASHDGITTSTLSPHNRFVVEARL